MDFSHILDQSAAVLAVSGFLYGGGRRLLRKRAIGRFAIAQQEVHRLRALFRAVREARDDAIERDIALATSISLETRGWIAGLTGMSFLGLGMISSEFAFLPTVVPLLHMLSGIVPYLFLACGLLVSHAGDKVVTRGNDIRLAFLGTDFAVETMYERLARLEHRHPTLAHDIQMVRKLIEETRRPKGFAWSWDGKTPIVRAVEPAEANVPVRPDYEPSSPLNSTPA